MGESLTTIVAIFLAAVLMFLFPLSAIADRNDDASQMYVQTTLDDFVNKVAAKGTLTLADYEQLEAQLEATNNSYDIDLVINVADVNPGKKTDNQKVGDTTYYSIYTAQLVNGTNGILEAQGTYYLKEGDYIKVSAINKNETIAKQIKSVLFPTGSESYSISAEASAITVTTGH